MSYTVMDVCILALVSLVSAHFVDTTLLNRCLRADDFSHCWIKHIGNQFVAPPLLVDVTMDPGLEVVALTQSGELSVNHAATGEVLQESAWPVKVDVTSVHSGPLLYDVNQDGSNDIIVISTEGDIRVYDIYGKPQHTYSRRLPDVFIQKDWYENGTSALMRSDGYHNYFGYILHSAESSYYNKEKYIHVHPHVFATGVIEDLNKDKLLDELVLPVTYMVEESGLYGEMNSADAQLLHSPGSYLASALLIFNLTTFDTKYTLFTRLDKKTSEYPPFVFTSPHIVTVSGTSLEIIIPAGNSLISLYSSGHRAHVLVTGESGIIEHVLTEDLVQMSDINAPELVYTLHSGEVVCVTIGNRQLTKLWRTDVKGKITGIRMFERRTVTGALFKVIVVATAEGNVWLLNGADGKPLPRWPLKLGKSLLGPPNIVQNLPDGPILVAVVDSDGYLHIASVEQKCKVLINIGETSRVGLVMHDLDPLIPGVEMLAATTHGSLIALGLHSASFHAGNLLNQASTEDMYSTSTLSLYAWPGEGKSHNDLMHSSHRGCVITELTGQASGLIRMQFSLFDHVPELSSFSDQEPSVWSADVYIGAQYVTTVVDAVNSPNQLDSDQHKKHLNIGTHSISFQTDKLSSVLHVELRCHFMFGHLHSHTVAYKVQQVWTSDLALLLLLPCLFLLFIFIADLFVKKKKGFIITGEHLE